MSPDPWQFSEIGERLKTYRLGNGLTAQDIADRLGISRAAVYRLEQGELVKVQVIEAIAEMLGMSLPTILGVGVEYFGDAFAFFERMREVEENTVQILGNFSPVSWLVLSAQYTSYLRTMLIEAIPDQATDRQARIDYIDRVLTLLEDRRGKAGHRSTHIVSLIGSQDVERFLRFGLIGRFDLPAEVHRERRLAARREIERLRDMMQREPLGIQLGVVEGQPPSQSFQICEGRNGSTVTLSPYRLGDQPNISSGIAVVTSAPEAVHSFKDALTRKWDNARKGVDGARVLSRILDRTASEF